MRRELLNTTTPNVQSPDSPRSNRVVSAHFRVQGHGIVDSTRLNFACGVEANIFAQLACWDFILWYVYYCDVLKMREYNKFQKCV